MSHQVVVVGGAGYIGSHAVAQLIKQGHQVLVFDNLSTGHKSLLHPKAEFVLGDLQDFDLLQRSLIDFKADSVMHFAALTSVEESLREPDRYYTNNFSGTLSLLKACQKSSVKNFIFSSTAAVYGDPVESLVSESSVLSPGTPYGKSKLMSELALQDAAQANGLRYMILRYFNVAGARVSGGLGQIGDHHTVLIKRAALAAVGKISELLIFGTDYQTEDGTAVRDYIHVEDLAEIHVLALHKLIRDPQSLILNCGYGAGFSVRQVLQMMKEVSGQDFKVREVERRPGDLPSVVADNSKLLQTLNWLPQRNDLRLICQTAYDWEVKSLHQLK